MKTTSSLMFIRKLVNFNNLWGNWIIADWRLEFWLSVKESINMNYNEEMSMNKHDWCNSKINLVIVIIRSIINKYKIIHLIIK